MDKLKILLMCLYCCCNVSTIVNGYMVNEDDKFEFKMFENFGLTKEVFLHEQKLVKELTVLKELLSEELKTIRMQMNDFLR